MRRFGFVLACLFLLSSFPLQALAAENVRVVEHQMVVVPQEGRLEFLSMFEVTNRGDEAAPQVQLDLPEGAEQIRPVEGFELPEVLDGRVVEHAPLGPGETRSYSVTYSVPVEGNRPVLMYQTSYVTETMTVLIPPERLAIEAEGFLTQSEPLNLYGQYFRKFTRLGLSAGQSWPLYFSLINPSNPGPSIDKSVHPSGLPVIYHDYGRGTLWALLNLVFIGSVLALGFIGVGSAHRRAQAAGRRFARESLAARREALMQERVELERKWRSGELEEAVYQSRKAELEKELLLLMEIGEGKADAV